MPLSVKGTVAALRWRLSTVVYVVVLSSSAVTSTVMTLLPTAREMSPSASVHAAELD